MSEGCLSFKFFKCERKGGAPANGAAYINGLMVRFQDVLYNGKAKPCAALMP